MPGSAAWLLLAVALAFLVHGRSLNHPWISDDHVILKDNPTLRRTTVDTPFRMLGLDYWSALDAAGQPFPLVGDRNLYRPATTVSYWLNARLTGIAPWGLRAGNILLHGLAAGLVGLLAASLFGRAPGWLAGASVLAHPVAADVINRIVGRADILVLVGIAGFLVVARAGAGSSWSPWRMAAAVVLALTALGAKETGLALIPMAVVQSWLMSPGPAATGRARWTGTVIALLAGGVFLAARTAVVGWPRYEPVPGLDLLMNPLAGMSLVERLPAVLSLAAYYLRLVVLPWPLLTLDRPARLPGWGDPDVWVGALVLAGMAAALIVLVRRRAPAGLAVAWWLALFGLVGQLIVPIGTLREVRLVYPFLGSLGLALAAAMAGVPAPARRLAAILASVAVAGWLVATVIRGGDYRSEIALYEADVRHQPEAPVTHLMLGVVYGDVGRADDARREREAALALAPDSPQALNEVAAVAIQAGDFARADALLGRAIAREPKHHVALMNLGNLRAQQGRFEEAHAILLRSEALSPAYSLTQVNLALVEALMGRTAEALRRADALERRNPSDPGVATIRRLAATAR